MKRNLPSLTGLRAFEAAARHMSFARAARELNVTPAAISQQIRQLEVGLGVKLFIRTTRSLKLSEQGQAASPFLRDGFDSLEKAARELSREDVDNTITVSVNPSFGSCWLLPRLENFRSAHPQFSIRVDARYDQCDFEKDGVDIAIREGRGTYPGLKSELLISDFVLVVCSHRLLNGKKYLKAPKELARKTLLHVDWLMEAESAPSWSRWVKFHSIDGLDVSGGLRFSLEEMAIRAAIAGMGFALVTHTFVFDDLAADRLVRALPSNYDMATEFNHYLVHPPLQENNRSKKTVLFRNWLLEEAALISPQAGGVGGKRTGQHKPIIGRSQAAS